MAKFCFVKKLRNEMFMCNKEFLNRICFVNGIIFSYIEFQIPSQWVNIPSSSLDSRIGFTSYVWRKSGSCFQDGHCGNRAVSYLWPAFVILSCVVPMFFLLCRIGQRIKELIKDSECLKKKKKKNRSAA